MNNKEVIDFIQEHNEFSESTRIRYEIDLEQYCDIINMSLHELINEAEDEADLNLRMRKRKITQHLMNFKSYLKENDYQPSTIKTKMSHIKAFYRAFEIDLPRIKNPTIKQNETILDVLEIKHIETAITNTSTLKHKALILTMASSGMGSFEILGLTVKDFIIATSDYHNETTIQNVLEVLSKEKTIIPCFYLIREKTEYEYYTFCSPEACEAICTFLRSRDNLTNESSLFDLAGSSLIKIFQRINDKHNFGWKKTRRMFHAHALRTFFATTVAGTEINGVPLDSLVIEWFMGHSVPDTTARYFKNNPSTLRNMYGYFVNKLSISKVKHYDLDSKEVLELKKILSETKKELNKEKQKQSETDERLAKLEAKEEKRQKVDTIVDNMTDEQLDKMLEFLTEK